MAARRAKKAKRKSGAKRPSPLANLAKKVNGIGSRVSHIETKMKHVKMKRKKKRIGALYNPAVEGGVIYED